MILLTALRFIRSVWTEAREMEREALRVRTETHEARANRRVRSMTEAA